MSYCKVPVLAVKNACNRYVEAYIQREKTKLEEHIQNVLSRKYSVWKNFLGVKKTTKTYEKAKEIAISETWCGYDTHGRDAKYWTNSILSLCKVAEETGVEYVTLSSEHANIIKNFIKEI